MQGKLKNFLILMPALCAGLTFIHCEESPTPQAGGGTGRQTTDPDKTSGGRGKTGNRDKNSDDDNKRKTGFFIADDDIPVGTKGNQCGDDSECEDDVCDDYFNGDRDCKKLPKRRALSLLTSLGKLEDARFRDVRLEDMGLALAISERFWIDMIEANYSADDGKDALEWIAETEDLLDLFLQTDEGDFIDILTYLWLKAHRAPDYSYQDSSRTNGWTIWWPIRGSIKGNLNFLALVLKEHSNKAEDFVTFMHENIVEEILCVPGLLPSPSTLSIRGVSRYSRAEAVKARQYKKEACVLGVYYVLVKDDDDREQVADWVDDTETDFIKRKQSEGGLSPEDSEIEDASEWSDEAEERLKFLWTDTMDSITLGL